MRDLSSQTSLDNVALLAVCQSKFCKNIGNTIMAGPPRRSATADVASADGLQCQERKFGKQSAGTDSHSRAIVSHNDLCGQRAGGASSLETAAPDFMALHQYKDLFDRRQ